MERVSNSKTAIWRLSALAVVAGLGLYLGVAAWKAIVSAFAHEQFPEALLIKVEELPIVFPVHMVTGGLALLLVPLALLLRGTRWHRIAGRMAAIDVLVAGVTAFPVALVAPVTPWSAAGFVAQAAVWLGLLTAGVWNIRHGRVKAHQTCMLLMAAVTSGAMFFRLYLGLWAVHGTRQHFKLFYAADAWLAWSLPLLAMAAVLYALRVRQRRPAPWRNA